MDQAIAIIFNLLGVDTIIFYIIFNHCKKQKMNNRELDASKNSEVPKRRLKWEYAIPIVFTPAAHICVSLIRSYPQHTTKLVWGVGITTFLTIQTRLILMYDAGYPGGSSKPKELPLFLRFFLL